MLSKSFSCAVAVLVALVLAPSLSAPAFAQDRTERLSFSAGRSSKTVRGSVIGYQGIVYLVSVRGGQRISVSMRTDNNSSAFNILGPYGQEALFNGSTSGNAGAVIAPVSGDYRIQVYLMRNAARRGEQANFKVTVAVTGGQPVNTEPDYADGNAGGPDFWQVANVPPGDRLNVRTRPSAGAAIVVRLRNGTVLRNLGCRSSGGTRWCKVERANGSGTGWAAGRFLIEAGG